MICTKLAFLFAVQTLAGEMFSISLQGHVALSFTTSAGKRIELELEVYHFVFVSVFFQLGKKCPFERFFCPKKINFDFNGPYLWTKTGFVALQNISSLGGKYLDSIFQNTLVYKISILDPLKIVLIIFLSLKYYLRYLNFQNLVLGAPKDERFHGKSQ